MRLLVTRPQPDAEDTATKLRALGHAVIVSPLLDIRCRPFAMPDPHRFDGLVVTSRNALVCLGAAGDMQQLCGLPLFAVGTATAKAARAMGFVVVIEGPGRAHDLIAVVAGHFAGASGIRLWYAAAEQKAFDLAPALAARGIVIDSVTLYDTFEARTLSMEAATTLAAGMIDAVLLMSPRTAELFVTLIRQQNLANAMRSVACLCLSENVAAALGELHCRQRLVAAEPRLENLLALIDNLA